jgi:cytochrome b6-f complex iron-sulfur subunit
VSPEGSESGNSLPRRAFVRTLLGSGFLGSLLSFFYPVARYLLPPPTSESSSDEVVAGQVSELKNNSGKIFRFGSKPGLLIRGADGAYRALSATCTHLDCTVQYRSDLQRVWCACHNGMYDLNGRNISGPPPRPLQQYEVHVLGDEIVVTRSQRS